MGYRRDPIISSFMGDRILAMAADYVLAEPVMERLERKVSTRAMTRSQADEAMAWIGRQEVRPGHLGWHPTWAVELGVYMVPGLVEAVDIMPELRLDLPDGARLFTCREFTPPGETRKKRYVREIIKLSKSKGERARESDRKALAAGAVLLDQITRQYWAYKLLPQHLMEMADLKVLSIKFGSCTHCGRTIWLKASTDVGMGDTCEGHQTRALRLKAERAAKEAAA